MHTHVCEYALNRVDVKITFLSHNITEIYSQLLFLNANINKDIYF